jgi:hypothetical protein
MNELFTTNEKQKQIKAILELNILPFKYIMDNNDLNINPITKNFILETVEYSYNNMSKLQIFLEKKLKKLNLNTFKIVYNDIMILKSNSEIKTKRPQSSIINSHLIIENNKTPSKAQVADLTGVLDKPEILMKKIHEALIKAGLQSYDIDSNLAAHQAMRVDINVVGENDYLSNVKRILNTMKYEKIDDFKLSEITSYSDSVVMTEQSNYSITEDTGMCRELSFKTAMWLKIMYPDKEYKIGEITNKLGGNHIFLIEVQPKGIFIIDPTFNKSGFIKDANKWFPKSELNSNADVSESLFLDYSNYKTFDIDSPLNVESVQKHTVEKGAVPKMTVFPLIAPRHLNLEDELAPFGVGLMLHSGYDVPLITITKKDGKIIAAPLDSNMKPESIQNYFAKSNIKMPLDFCKRIVIMWKSIEDNGGVKSSQENYNKK